MKIRLAEPTDIDDVLDIVIAARPQEPSWDYRYPYRLEYPEDHRYLNRLAFEFFLKPSHDDWLVTVVECPDNDNPALSRIAAFAVWDVSYVNKRKHGPTYVPPSRESPDPRL